MPPAIAADDSLIGDVLADKYRVVRQIGRGGMGVVYEAEHIALGKRVAIKLMLEKYAEDSEAIARFQREALAASRIGNPHIIDVSDIGNAPDGRSFVVMELLNGMPLSQVLEMTGPMPPWRAIGIMRQVLRAVGAAHAKGIIHRDLKPDNIFLIGQDDQHDFVKLLDFGISKVMDHPDEQIAFTKLTSTGVVMGTPLYMAPEQAMGQSIDAAADIYACGVILYELLAGRPPFEGQTYAVLVAKLLTQEPEYLAQVRPGLPLALVNAVHRALQKEPQRRFPTAEQFAASLPGERTVSQIELAGTLDSGIAVARVVPLHKSKRPLIAVAAALLVGVATAGVLIATQTGAETPRPEPAASPAPAPRPTVEPITQPAPVQIGTLEVKTTPPGAAVSVDGSELGRSPILVTLMPGKHVLRVDLFGYDVFETEVEIRVGSTTAAMIPLAKTTLAAKPGSRPKKPATASIIRTTPTIKPPTIENRPPGEPKTVKPPVPVPTPEPEPKKPATTGTDSKPNPYTKPNPY